MSFPARNTRCCGGLSELPSKAAAVWANKHCSHHPEGGKISIGGDQHQGSLSKGIMLCLPFFLPCLCRPAQQGLSVYVNQALTVFTNCLHRGQREFVLVGVVYLTFTSSIVTTVNSSLTVLFPAFSTL